MDDFISPEASWQVIFTPLYITLGSMFVVPLLHGIIDNIAEWSEAAPIWIILSFIFAFVICAPVVAFLAILGQTLDGDRDFSTVHLFIPFFVQFSVAALGMGVATFFRIIMNFSS